MLERLASELHETAILHAFEGDRVVAIDKAETDRSLRYSVKLGERWPTHSSSAGKLYLAELDDDAVRRLAEQHGLEPVTSHTIAPPITSESVAGRRSKINSLTGALL